MTKNDLLWIVIVIAPFAVVALVKLVLFVYHFKKELRYIDSEIARSGGAERERWLRQKRRLWRSLLPFLKR